MSKRALRAIHEIKEEIFEYCIKSDDGIITISECDLDADKEMIKAACRLMAHGTGHQLVKLSKDRYGIL